VLIADLQLADPGEYAPQLAEVVPAQQPAWPAAVSVGFMTDE
jgi:hypothetical protein